MSINVLLFAKFYIKHVYFQFLFYRVLSIFIFSIHLLLISKSSLTLIFSWELLGTSSWLLILFYSRWSRAQGALLTRFLNRFGDIFLLIRLLMCSYIFSFSLVSIIVMIALTKSAQFPFHSWLPAAMAAPTPVSALVHSSTLVAAGIYLIVAYKCSFFRAKLIKFIFTLGISTLSLGSFICYLTIDLKKQLLTPHWVNLDF